jgi:hypothetical protein
MQRTTRLNAFSPQLLLVLGACLATSFALPRAAQLEGHEELRAAVLEQLGTAQEVDPEALLVTSAGAAHVIAGAPPLARVTGDDVLGLMLLQGQGKWRGGEAIADGVYHIRRGEGPRMVELQDEGGEVVASFTLDFPTGEGDESGGAPVRWPRLYVEIARDLIPSAR